ncbi:unnamed protein product [Rhizophagus irregularis]|nr:unnamed protein product [Rhizophagus irregularis]
MFTCPYQHCGVTFSRHAALREHTKSHKGQAYWEILTDTSSNFNNLGENNITDQFNFIEFEQDVNNESDEQIEHNDNEEQGDSDEQVENSDSDDNVNDNDNSFITEYDNEPIEEDINERVEHIHNYSLHFPEQTNQSTSINLRSIQNTPELPDAAYTEFMELASTHKFSDSAGNDVLKWFRKYHLQENIVLPTNMAQGREFINSMNIDHLLYLKTKVLTYEDEEYYLHHRPIFDAIKELLSNSDILKNCQWDFSPEYIINDNGQNEHVYGEQWTGLWWESAQKAVGMGLKKVLSIILYSDATTLDHLGKSSEHPVYLSLGNIANWCRNKRDAKVLLGFLPKLKQLHNRKNNKDNFVLAKRMLYQHCFDIMTQPIYEKLENNGLDIILDNQIIWAFPFLSEFIGDLPEDAALTLTYASSRCKRPCHICTVTIDELNNPNLSRSQIESKICILF